MIFSMFILSMNVLKLPNPPKHLLRYLHLQRGMVCYKFSPNIEYT